MADQLTDTKIRNAKAVGKPKKLFDGRGLFLLVTPRGGKWWRFKYRFDGKAKLISLGVYPDVGLKQVRERREEKRKLVASGIDPSAERQAAKARRSDDEPPAGVTFEEVAREWLKQFSDQGQPPSAQGARGGKVWVHNYTRTVVSRLERDVFPWIGGEPIAALAVDSKRILEVLRRVEGRGAVSTAHRIKRLCGQVFRFAIATGRAPRDPSRDLLGALREEKGEHFGAVTEPGEVAALVRAFSAYQGSFIVRCALRFSVLVFQRPGEIRKAEWKEFDWAARLWRIPAERMKMRRSHLVPLARQAIELLLELQPLTGKGRFIFPGARSEHRPMSENAVGAALRYMGYERGVATAHGLRTTARTMLREQGWPDDAIERQLAHVDRDKTRAAYDRAELLPTRREMMQAWADYLDSLAKIDPAQNNYSP